MLRYSTSNGDDSYDLSFQNELEKEHKKKLQFKFAWNQMPAELRPLNKRKNTAKPNKAKRLKVVSTEVVEQKFKILEQKEMENPDGDEKSVKGNESDEEIENVSKKINFLLYNSRTLIPTG
jgi:hypothetical protein